MKSFASSDKLWVMRYIDLEGVPRKKGVYIVGGCLRDALLGRTPGDMDMAVKADTEKFARDLANRLKGRFISLGRQGHAMYRVVAGDRIFDISPLQGATIEDDLQQRDFSINALAYDVISENLIDKAQGLKAIQGRQIRLVSKNCFQDDPLRLLRAFRLAAQLGFEIEKKTLQALQSQAPLIRRVAGERVRSELFDLLCTSRSYETSCQMADTGLLLHIFPEMKPMQGCRQNRYHDLDVFEHTLQTLGKMETLMEKNQQATRLLPILQPMGGQRRIRLKLAALLHDIGKPQSRQKNSDNRVRFCGHEVQGARMTDNIAKRLRMSRKDTTHVRQLVRWHLRPLQLFRARQAKSLTQRAMTRFFLKAQKLTPDVLLLSASDMRAKRQTVPSPRPDFEKFLTELMHQYAHHYAPGIESAPLVNGRDLIRYLRLTPSPLFKEILNRVRECQLSGEITTREEALALAADFVSGDQA